MRLLTNTTNFLFVQQLQEKLQEKGIKSSFSEENSTYISVCGDITSYNIYVDDADFQKATAIMNSLKSQEQQTESLPWCPECGSENVTKEVIKLKYSPVWYLILDPIVFFVGLWLPHIFCWICLVCGFVLIIQFFKGETQERFTCNSCKHTFRR